MSIVLVKRKKSQNYISKTNNPHAGVIDIFSDSDQYSVRRHMLSINGVNTFKFTWGIFPFVTGFALMPCDPTG